MMGTGVVVMPRRPIVGSVWELREVLPRDGVPYSATVERVWRDKDGRLMGSFIGAGGRSWECELWLELVGAGQFPTREASCDDDWG